MSDLLSTLQEKSDTFLDYVLFFVIAIVGFLLVSTFFRFVFGKKNQLGKAITSAMEILCLYVICTVVYSFGLHWDLFVDPLPFITLQNDTLAIFPIIGAGFTEICAQFAKLLLIAFLVNLMNSIIPKGKNVLVWLLLRATTVVLAIGVNYVLDMALGIWLPQGIANIAPLILLAALVLLILLGSLKLIVGAALFVANPVIGALYTFFFSNFIGRALARSIITAGLITALVYLMNTLGLLTIALSTASLIALIPILLVVILLWYIVDRIL